MDACTVRVPLHCGLQTPSCYIEFIFWSVSQAAITQSVLMDFCYTFNQVWFVDCLCFVYFYLLELKMCGLIWEGWYCRHGLLQVHINLNPGLVYFSNGC